MGVLFASPSRGKEIFSFEYDQNWLKSSHAQTLDPSLQLFRGQQYAPEDVINFRLFLDSSPDRWGRVLMQRREEQCAREEKREKRTLLESDYLLGVYDGHRMGGLRFRLNPEGPFLDSDTSRTTPPWTSLRELEHASLELEKDHAEKKPDYAKWLKMLIAPGTSLGGARPKASVVDKHKHLWIAKFPSRTDRVDKGAWEEVVQRLARNAGIRVAPTQTRVFGSQRHTFMTKRFDRNDAGERLHFASAMTLLQRSDGDDASTGASYLELAEFLVKQGSKPNEDLEELWKRIVFFICISNVDDHLRNHGFLLETQGWRLAPAYDMNPDPLGDGLKLNISETDNSQNLELAGNVADIFRVKRQKRKDIIQNITRVTRKWRAVAEDLSISKKEQDLMQPAFRVAEKM